MGATWRNIERPSALLLILRCSIVKGPWRFDRETAQYPKASHRGLQWELNLGPFNDLKPLSTATNCASRWGCESILQPGFNCTIRIEKNRAKVRGRRRSRSKPTQNNVVYTCHFCSHRNLMRGTPKGRMKEIRPPKPKRAQQKPVQRVAQKGSDLERETESNVKSTADQMVSPPLATEKDAAGSPVTPLKGRCSLLLEGKRRKSGSKKPTESEKSNAEDAEKVASASSKRRRRSWTSLKEIAESSGRDGSSGINNLAIPFFI